MMNTENKYLANVRKLYGYWFFHSLIFAYVIERLFWEQRGMTVQQVVYTEFIYAAVIIVFEVPTGSLADYWSRKTLIVLSAVFSFAEFVILIFAHSFWHFALAVVVAAIGKTLSSGTSNALLYDSLKLSGAEESFEKIVGRVNFLDRVGGLIAALAGSLIAWKCRYEVNYWLSLISLAVAFFLAMTLAEPAVINEDKRKEYRQHIKEAFKFLKFSPAVKFVVIFGIVMAASLTYVDEFWQIYLKEIKIPILFFGIVSAGNSLVFSLASAFIYKLKKLLSYKAIFSILLLQYSMGILLCSFTKSWIGIIPLLASYTAAGSVEPLVYGYLHHRADSTFRATAESFQSLALRVTTLITGLFFGWFSSHYNILIGFRFLGITALIYLAYHIVFQLRYLGQE